MERPASVYLGYTPLGLLDSPLLTRPAAPTRNELAIFTFRGYRSCSKDESPPYFDPVNSPLFLLPTLRDKLLRFDFELQEIFRHKCIRQ